MESEREEEVVNKRRSSILEILHGYVDDVLINSSESKDGPQFLDNGLFSPYTGGLGSFTLGKRPIWVFQRAAHYSRLRKHNSDSNYFY